MKLYKHIVLGGQFEIRDDRTFRIVEEPTVEIWEMIGHWWRSYETIHHTLTDEDLEYFVSIEEV